jgi:hypothetical protein
LEINWKAVHSEFLEGLKGLTDLLPEKTRKAYVSYEKYQRLGLVEPELEIVPQIFRTAVTLLVNSFVNIKIIDYTAHPDVVSPHHNRDCCPSFRSPN